RRYPSEAPSAAAAPLRLRRGSNNLMPARIPACASDPGKTDGMAVRSDRRQSLVDGLSFVEKGRRCRPFPTGHVSTAPWARPGKRAGKPCCARLPNPPRMSPGSDGIWRASALQASPKGFFDGLNGRHAKELPPRAAPEKRHMFPETRRKP